MAPAASRKRAAGGPKTAAGKARSAQNSRKHGLAVPARLDPAWAPAIEPLAHALAGPGAGAARLSLARVAAEAEVDLRRARRARMAVLRRPPPAPPTGDLLKAWTRLAAGQGFDAHAQALSRLLQAPAGDAALWQAAARGLGELAAVERYERRAFSRRRSALRALAAEAHAPRDTGSGAAAAGPHAAAAEAGVAEWLAADDARMWTTRIAVAEAAPLGPPPAAPTPAASAPGGAPAAAVPNDSHLAERTAGPYAEAPGGPPRATDPSAPTAGPQDASVPPGGDWPCGDGPGRTRPPRPPATLPAGPGGGAAAWEAVAEMAFAGMTDGSIARSLGLTTDELRARHAHALDAGPAILQGRVAAALIRRAVAGDTRAAIFLAKARCGWRDGGPASRTPMAPTPEEAEAKQETIDRILAMMSPPAAEADG